VILHQINKLQKQITGNAEKLSKLSIIAGDAIHYLLPNRYVIHWDIL
jgi:hypothetical protein